MRSPRKTGDDGRWERTVARCFNAFGIPVQWDYSRRRFIGLSGINIKRIAPMRSRLDDSQSLTTLPRTIRIMEESGEQNPIIVVTNRHYGDTVEDSLVVLRLGSFLPMLAVFVESDRERYINAVNNSG